MKRDLVLFLILQFVTVVLVMVGFHFIGSTVVAGLVGGVLFVGMCIFNLWRMWKWPRIRTSPTFWSTLLFLAVVALPMVIQRLMHLDMQFSQIQIWGIDGPTFHHLSSKAYSAMMALTAAELFIRFRTS